MPDQFNVDPVIPGEFSPIETDLTPYTNGMSWSSATYYVINREHTGWSNLKTAIQGGALLIADDQNQLVPFTNYEATNRSVPGETYEYQGKQLRRSETDPEYRRLMQASIDGRLFVRHAQTQKLMQMLTKQPDTGSTDYTFDLSKPLDHLPWVEPPLEKPEKPGLWTRFVAFLFKNSQAAQTMRDYETALAAYNEQQARLNPQPEAGAAQPNAAQARPVRGKVPESLDGIFSESTFTMLSESVEAQKPLDPKATQENIAAQKANECYQEGLKSHRALLGVLRDGTFEFRDQGRVRDILGNAMLGEMVRRGVQEGNKDAFYQQINDDPNFLATWKEHLLNTPAAKQLLAGGAEAMGRAVGYFTHFATLMNNAIPQARGLATQANIQDPNPVIVNDGPTMTNNDPKPIVPGAPN